MAVPIVFLGLLDTFCSWCCGSSHDLENHPRMANPWNRVLGACLDEPHHFARACKRVGMDTRWKMPHADKPARYRNALHRFRHAGHHRSLARRPDGFEAGNDAMQDVAVNLDNGHARNIDKVRADARAAIKELDDNMQAQPSIDGLALPTFGWRTSRRRWLTALRRRKDIHPDAKRRRPRHCARARTPAIHPSPIGSPHCPSIGKNTPVFCSVRLSDCLYRPTFVSANPLLTEAESNMRWYGYDNAIFRPNEKKIIFS